MEAEREARNAEKTFAECETYWPDPEARSRALRLFREAEALGIAIQNPVVDTLRLARKVFPKLACYKLGYLTDYFCIAHDTAHRACSDADATAKLYLMMRTSSTTV